MTPWKNQRIVMLDVETTGLHDTARIVQMASVIGDCGNILRGRVLLVNPEEPIPAEASAIHGVTNEMVADKPRFDQYAALVYERIHEALPAAYNAPFDRRVFAFELALSGFNMDAKPWIDPLPWIWKVDKFKKGKKLADACRRRGIPLKAHDALGDASAALALLYYLAPKLPDDLDELHAETERLRTEQQKEREAYHAQKAAAQAAVDAAAKELADRAADNDAQRGAS